MCFIMRMAVYVNIQLHGCVYEYPIGYVYEYPIVMQDYFIWQK